MSETQEKSAGQTILELDIDELENACKHLERSNKELLEFVKETEPESQQALLDAVEENKRVLVTKRKKIEDLKLLLKRGQSSHQIEESITMPAPAPAPSPERVPVLVNETASKDDKANNEKDPRLETGVFL